MVITRKKEIILIIRLLISSLTFVGKIVTSFRIPNDSVFISRIVFTSIKCNTSGGRGVFPEGGLERFLLE